jgi:hypothetical protein
MYIIVEQGCGGSVYSSTEPAEGMIVPTLGRVYAHAGESDHELRLCAPR